ncbi:MAG: DEAD/DEAH box helicase family protein, partial [Gordonia sp. (in: high G+C Gram-positive bacteria)]
MADRHGEHHPPRVLDVDAEMSRLSDFQTATADYTFARLFGDGADSTSRFLVADEVGLGKTIVARGVIAQTIAHLHGQNDSRIDIVYICSNESIAEQNLRKLAPAGVDVEHHSQRLSLLPFDLRERADHPVSLIALTPGTSMKLGHSGGLFEERAAALAALSDLWGGHRLRGKGIGTLFAGGIKDYPDVSKEDRIRERASYYRGRLSKRARELLAEEIAKVDAELIAESGDDTDAYLHRVAHDFGAERSEDATRGQRRILHRLRAALSNTGARLLQPDLVILDEFQRFRDILQGDDEAATSEDRYAASIAERLLSFHHEDHGRDTRVLMLSATPYTMHSSSVRALADPSAPSQAAGVDDHYQDFLATYRFLVGGLPGTDVASEVDGLSKDLFELRRTISDSVVDGIDPALIAAGRVGDRLRKVMTRSERLSATINRDGMLTERGTLLPVPDTAALKQFRSTAQIIEQLRAITAPTQAPRVGDVVSYWKAAPYTLSYLDRYKVLADLRDTVESGSKSSRSLLQALQRSPAVLPWKSILAYRVVPSTHAGLARLWSDFFDTAHAERLLWLPPSLPYYRAGGDFETQAARRLTKRLIFSSWDLAPTAIATLTSYECERRMMSSAKKAGRRTNAYDARRRSTRPLQYRGKAESLAHLLFDTPFPRLAELTDPISIIGELRA